jgi:CRP/FNR family nitrogen fixation transcriptional regulator
MDLGRVKAPVERPVDQFQNRISGDRRPHAVWLASTFGQEGRKSSHWDGGSPGVRGRVKHPRASTDSEHGEVSRNERAVQQVTPRGWPFVANGINKAFVANEELFGEGEPANYIYRVVHGSVRTFKVFDDGGRQIEAFRLPGDVFGFESSGYYRFGAEAIGDVSAVLFDRRAILRETRENCDFTQEILNIVTDDLERVQQHTLLLSNNALQRVACFLVEMSARLRQKDLLQLPMGRQDIADYLGLTIETVSRTFAHLAAARLVKVAGLRGVVLLNIDALRSMSRTPTDTKDTTNAAERRASRGRNPN